MAANDLEYGWYKWEDGFRQKDGFFVDRSGNVLYWPTGKGPGYVMDEAAIESVSRHKAYRKKVRSRVGLFAIVLFVVFYFVLDESIRRFIEFFMLPFIVAAFAIVFEMIASAVILRRRGLDLSHRPMVYAPRPTVRDTLVVAKVRRRDEFWGPIAGRVAVVLLLIAVGIYFFDSTVAKWFAGVSAKALLDQGFLWSSGVLAVLGLAWRIIELVRARHASVDAEEVRARIKVTDGLETRRLWDEEDAPEVPEELRIRDDPETRRLRRYDRN